MPETFHAFMARALHDPQQGYYARQVRTVGRAGDFSTSATLSPLLGQALAAWLNEESRAQPEVRHIIEVGAGQGALMQTVRQSLGWWRRRRFTWHLVETSAPLRQAQQACLPRDCRWHEDLRDALKATDGRAFIYHNELLDAFPVTLLQWQEDRWHEVCVEMSQHGAVESLQPWPVQEGFSALAPPKHPQQRCELHDSVRHWLRHWSPAWKQGAMLTVDYGDLYPALYHRRPHGTLRAYLLHQRLEGDALYANPGRQDITADINFTDYRAWADELGWEERLYKTQAEFIRSMIPHAEGQIMDELGAGGAFKVLAHRPGTRLSGSAT